MNTELLGRLSHRATIDRIALDTSCVFMSIIALTISQYHHLPIPLALVYNLLAERCVLSLNGLIFETVRRREGREGR
jgi:hypothetical protein